MATLKRSEKLSLWSVGFLVLGSGFIPASLDGTQWAGPVFLILVIIGYAIAVVAVRMSNRGN